MVSRRTRALAAIAAVAAAATAWWWPAAATPEDDLWALAAELSRSDDPFFGGAQVDALVQQRAALRPDERLARIDVDLRLGGHRLRLGDVEGAIAAYQQALADARSEPLLAAGERGGLQEFHLRLGLAYLRQAEKVNCIARHAPACCVWPLQGDGLHRDAAPAERALDAFLEYLRVAPDDQGVRWLANVAAAAARQAERLPPALRWPAIAPATAPQFVDRAPDLGVDAFDLCGGAAVVDVDGDGRLDLVSSAWGQSTPMKLFVRTPDGAFADRAGVSGLARQPGGLNLTVADHDNDGDPDLLVLRGAWLLDRGQIRNSLLENDGAGNFRDVTAAAGLMHPARPTQTGVWADFDGDGDLDLFVGNESRQEIGPHPGGDYPCQLFRNDGGRYVDVAASAGVTNDRYCKGACVGDYDDDGDLDLYVSNIGANRLYRNDGGLHFTDVAAQLGVTEPSGRSFACWFFDYDHDGRLDLFVAGFQATLREVASDLLRQAGEHAPAGGTQPRLYRNLGGRFADVTAAAGLARVTLPMGANFCDFDGDGWLDIYLATGEPGYEVLVPNVMLRNAAAPGGGRTYVDATTATGLGHLQKGHGVAFADIDQDGDQDLWHQLGGFYPDDAYYNALFENRGGGRLLSIELVGTRSNRDATGARLRVDLAAPSGARSLHRAVGCVSSFGGSSARQELGLGDATAVTKVVVRWPAGGEQQFVDLPLGGHVRLVEGRVDVEVLTRPPLPLVARSR